MKPNHGFVDLQINGCFGVDFNADDLAEHDLVRACERLRAEGTAGFLATVITADIDAMIGRIQRIVALRAKHLSLAESILGVHIEGPFLNVRPGFAGAHPVQWLRPTDEGVMQRLLDAGEGLVRMVTLAPELDENFRIIRRLARQGIIVSAGHCDPTRDQLEGAADAGLRMFTHLGNGCPVELPRHDNIIQRVLSLSDRLWCSLIVDGVHIPFFVVSNWLRCIGCNRAVVVSDAIAGAGMGAGQFSLGGAQVNVSPLGRTQLAGGSAYLAGSTTTLAQAARNLREHLGLNEEQVRLLTADNPRQLLGIR